MQANKAKFEKAFTRRKNAYHSHPFKEWTRNLCFTLVFKISQGIVNFVSNSYTWTCKVRRPGLRFRYLKEKKIHWEEFDVFHVCIVSNNITFVSNTEMSNVDLLHTNTCFTLEFCRKHTNLSLVLIFLTFTDWSCISN